MNMQISNRILAKATRRFFEGDDGAQPAGGTVTAPPPPVVEPPPTQQASDRKFSQAELDNIVKARVATEQKKASENNKKVVEQLQEIQKSQQLTQQEKDALQARIEELQATYRTQEETKKIEIDKINDKHNKDIRKLTDERDIWKRHYESDKIAVAISRAAVKHEAVSPEQIEAFLTPRTRVIEELGPDGKPNGGHTTRVKFEDVDAEGKPLILELGVEEAVKLMRERTNRFGNLFKNSTNGGTGSVINPNPGGQPTFDLARMSTQDYQKNRAAIHQKMRDDRAKAG